MNKTKEKSISQTNIHEKHRERMREIYLKNGFDAFSEVEVLEYMLFFVLPRIDTNPLAHKLLNKFGSLANVLEAPVEALMQIDGIGRQTALYLNLMLNVANRYSKNKCTDKISNSIEAKEYCAKLFVGKTVEEFYIICLSSTNHVISCDKIGTGSASEVGIQMKDITKSLIFRNCDRIIVCHNHPRGIARPSDEDLSFTCNILSNCIINDVDVLDHIIVSDNNQFSFLESGLWLELRKDAINKLANKKQYMNFLQPASDYTIS